MRTQGTKTESDGLKRCISEVNLTDLQNDEVAFGKFKLITEDVQGKNCLTSFHGIDLTCDKMCSTKKHSKKTFYVQHQQVWQIHMEMMEIMTWGVQTSDLKEVVSKLIPASFGKDIEKACQSIYLLYNVFVRKVKMLKKSKFELGKLMELHGEVSSSGKAAGNETGAKVKQTDGYEPPVQESV